LSYTRVLGTALVYRPGDITSNQPLRPDQGRELRPVGRVFERCADGNRQV